MTPPRLQKCDAFPEMTVPPNRKHSRRGVEKYASSQVRIYFFLSIPDDWNLEIRNVTLEDDGLYDCQILGSRSPAARLTVFVPPNSSYVRGGTVREVIENQDVALTCVSVGGKPAPKASLF